MVMLNILHRHGTITLQTGLLSGARHVILSIKEEGLVRIYPTLQARDDPYLQGLLYSGL
jgi:hypothetical protein